MYRKNTINGFTIVELLIVIVVIGILASITIVSFNGVQQRAKTTQTVAIAKAYINALKLWEADKGSLPLNESCLGPATAFLANLLANWASLVHPPHLERCGTTATGTGKTKQF
ncbi:MAG: prepilin-type N-terminal cleavage/methylation domain-containing protein [Chloroflexi bacterium]|nr:MAG: prepilin-type N-terminal cleavage/methylation domain-containing protein [Chloroflexota bacterium]